MATTKEKILELAEKVKNPPNWWWKVLGGLLLFAAAMWIYWLLSHKAKELANARTELAAMKLKAMQAEVAAAVEKDEAKRKVAEAAAKELFAKAHAHEETIVALEADHAKSLMQVKAVQDKDWETLNKLAGVQP